MGFWSHGDGTDAPNLPPASSATFLEELAMSQTLFKFIRERMCER